MPHPGLSEAGPAAFSNSRVVYLGPDTMLAVTIGGEAPGRSTVARIVRQKGRAQTLAELPAVSRAFAIDSARRFVAVARDDGSLSVINLRTDSVRSQQRATRPLTAVAFGRGGRLAVASADGIILVSRQTETVDSMFQAGFRASHDRAVVRLVFDRSGQLLASGDEGGTTRIWQLDRSRELCSLEGQHADYIRAIAFAPSGRTLATADERGVAIWFIDAAQSSCRFAYRLADLDAPTAALGFRPDGSALVVVGRDGITRIYARNVWAPRDSLVALAERRLRGRQLTPEETRRYVDRR